MRRRSACLLFACSVSIGTASAQDIQIVIQRAALAGFSHHAAPAQWERMRPGDPLRLVREPANPHDSLAIQVYWYDQLIGYLPRTENGAVARALDRGMALEAAIFRLTEHPDPRRRVEIEVRARMGAMY